MRLLTLLLATALSASAAEIHDAASTGDVAALQRLIQRAPSLLASKDNGGNQPLHLAASGRKVEAVELLIKLGADVNAAGFEGWTPLHLAAKSGSTDAVTALLKAGASIDAKNASGQIPLQVAAHDFIRKRLAATEQNLPGLDAFLVAVKKGDLSALDEHLTKTPALIKAEDATGTTALMTAAGANQAAAARWLLEHGADARKMRRNGTTALLVACEAENVEIVQLLLEKGADPDPRTDKQESPLVSIMVLTTPDPAFGVPSKNSLISENPTVPLQMERAITDLQKTTNPQTNSDRLDFAGKARSATEVLTKYMIPLPPERLKARLRIAELLLQYKADVNRPSPVTRMNALSAAAMGPDASGVELLLKHGANPDLANEIGGTALVFAVIANNDAAVDALLAAGAKVAGYAPGTNSQAPLSTAAVLGREAMLEKMLARAKPERSVLAADVRLAHNSVRSPHAALVRRLLDAGMNPRATNDSKETPLHEAAVQGTPEVIALLHDAGAELETKDFAGFTPLHSAAEAGRVASVNILAERGARLDCRSNDNRTPLHSSTETGSLEVIKLLLTLKVDVNAVDKFSATPLMSAALLGKPDALALLLEHHADVTLVHPKFKCTALHLAAQIAPLNRSSTKDPTELLRPPNGSVEDHVRCVELLLKAGADIEAVAGNLKRTALGIAAESGKLPIVEVLLRHGARVDNSAGDNQSRVPLHYAAFQGHAEVVRALMKAGAKDVPTNTAPGGLASAVHYAAGNNRVDALKALLDGGANMNARDFHRATPLMWAAAAGHKGTVTLLLARGADPNTVANADHTALSLAKEKGHDEIVRLLVEASLRK